MSSNRSLAVLAAVFFLYSLLVLFLWDRAEKEREILSGWLEEARAAANVVPCPSCATLWDSTIREEFIERKK